MWRGSLVFVETESSEKVNVCCGFVSPMVRLQHRGDFLRRLEKKRQRNVDTQLVQVVWPYWLHLWRQEPREKTSHWSSGRCSSCGFHLPSTQIKQASCLTDMLHTTAQNILQKRLQFRRFTCQILHHVAVKEKCSLRISLWLHFKPSKIRNFTTEIVLINEATFRL
jgi:hypothetical protein